MEASSQFAVNVTDTSMGAGRENGTALQRTCCVIQLGVVWGSVVAVERRGAGWFRC